MYAVIETGGKQYRVKAGDVIDVEKFEVPSGKSRKVNFDRVLLVSGEKGTSVGAPTVAGAKVSGTLVEDVRGPKILIFKQKRRKGYRRLNGHRQDLLSLPV